MGRLQRPTRDTAHPSDQRVAKALRDDYHRLGELVRKKDPLTAAEVEEESKLRVRRPTHCCRGARTRLASSTHH
jgi:hypothetical protein